MNIVDIREVSLADAEAIAFIQAEAVAHHDYLTQTSTETISAIKQSIETLPQHYPFIVATIQDEIVGFAYAAPFSPRIAFSHACVASLCVPSAFHLGNTGQQLLEELERLLEAASIIQVLTNLVSSNERYLNFLAQNGFNHVGHLPQIGNQANQRLDVTWMMKTLIPH